MTTKYYYGAIQVILEKMYLLNKSGNFSIDEKNSNVGAGFIPARNVINAAIRAGINPAPTKNSPNFLRCYAKIINNL